MGYCALEVFHQVLVPLLGLLGDLINKKPAILDLAFRSERYNASLSTCKTILLSLNLTIASGFIAQ